MNRPAPPVIPASRPLALAGWLPVWDLERRRVDLDEVIAWVQAQLRRRGVVVDDLSALSIDGDDARALATELTQHSLCAALRRPLHRALRTMLPRLPWDRLWIQSRAHVRIVVPGDTKAAVPAHTDYGFGHGLEERNIWLALTDATEPGALRIWDLEHSLRWQLATGCLEGVADLFDELPAIPARHGDTLLFTPLHIHAAQVPTTATRVSIDLRIVPARDSRANLTFGPLFPQESSVRVG